MYFVYLVVSFLRTLLLCLILYLLYLVWERIALNRSRRRIPLCIAVTGTRGKSGVARIIASIFREDGRRVFVKTTGSQAIIQSPDGGEIELDRSIPPSILEQKQLVRQAARGQAGCLVAELMSIHPENHYVESRRILRPDVVVITNVRRDHTEAMGETEDEIASVISLGICRGSEVFLPAGENRPAFRAEAQRCGAKLVAVAPGSSVTMLRFAPDVSRLEFRENLDLAVAVGTRFGIGPPKIIEGIRKARQDIGRLRVWTYRHAGCGSALYLVNAFAANDPDSTFQVLHMVAEALPSAAENIIGVLNLRSDRVPRTVQWLAFLKQGHFQRFRQLFVTGGSCGWFRRKLPGVSVLTSGAPEAMMEAVCAGVPGPAIIFGFGNVKGSGRLLLEYWSGIGTPWAPACHGNGPTEGPS